MKLVGKVPVEPLDDERLTNIERSLVVRVSEMRQQRGLGRLASAMTAPRRLLAITAVAVAVLVAGVVGWELRGGGARGGAGKPEQLAMKAGALDLGDAQIAGGDFTVTRTPARVEIVMQPGTLDLHVEHLPERLFVVKAGDVEIEDVGTRFTVAYDGKNVDVRVTEGEVKVKHAGKDIAVTASNAWTLELGPIAIADLEAREQLAVLDDVNTPPGDDARSDGAGAATAAANAAQPTASTASTGASAGSTASTGASAGSSAGTGASGTPSASGTGSSSGAGGHAGPAKKPGRSNARKALAAVPVTPAIDVGIAEPAAAVNEYSKRIAAMAGDTSRMLYSMALVQHRAGNDAGALRTLVGVTRREGGDAYRDGMWLDVRIKCLRAFDEECRRAAERFRHKFDSGQATGALDAVLSEIYQQR